MARRNAKSSRSADLRKRAEERIRKIGGGKRLPSSRDFRATLHELDVHRVELELQNEELRQAQQELEASRNRYAELYDFAPVGYVTLDRRGRILEINLTASDLLGRERSALVGRPLVAFVSRGRKSRFLDHLKRCLEDGAEAAFECELRLQEGGSIPVEFRSRPWRDEKGTPAFRGVLIDLTERKRAETALREAHDRAAWLARLPDENPSPVLRVSAEGRVLYRNPAAAALSGWICKVDQPMPQALLPLVREAMARGSQTQRDLLLGGRSYLVWVAPFARDGYANLYGLDITAIREAEQALAFSRRRAEFLARTAARFLAGVEPQSLVEELCREVMAFLDCQVFFNFLVDERAGRLHLNACAGVPEADVSRIEWLDYGAAVCGCVARDGRRIVAEDILHTLDPRTALVKSFGVQAYACNPLMVQGKLIGTLSFGTRSRPRFSEDDLSLMAAVADLVAIAMRRIKSEERIKSSLHEKEVLLKEVHHRVKNNMQVVCSLVNLQADALADPTLRDVFDDLRDRVRSMALVHEQLYKSESLARVDFGEYARTLLTQIWSAHGETAARVRLKLDLRPVPLSIETAVPCGLILNELSSNALKHAFRDRSEGEVTVTLRAGEDGRVCLGLGDNGVGLPPGMDWSSSRSLGLRMVQVLAQQLNATVEVRAAQGCGTEFQVCWEEKPIS